MDPLASSNQSVGMLVSRGAVNSSSIIVNTANSAGSGTEVNPSNNKNLETDQVFSYTISASSQIAASSSTAVSSHNVSMQSGSSFSSPSTTMRGRSRVWNEFSVTPCGRKVTCHRCGDCLAYSNSHSTSSMLKHLKRKHSLDLYPSLSSPSDDGGGGEGGNDASTSSTSALSQADTRFKSTCSSFDKRSRPASNKRHIVPPQQVPEEADTSIQHGPLLFKDLCVRMKWTDHTDTFLRTFSTLYSDESYTDVTVVVEQNFFKAHRVILSSASDFFNESFKVTPTGQHPIIFLKDVKAVEFRILLDFIYKGEVSIPPGMIPGLVKIGSELKVRGLSDFVWNEQLASNVFQAKPPQPSQQAMPHPGGNERYVAPAAPGSQTCTEPQFVATGTTTASIKMAPSAAVRTLIRRSSQQTQLLGAQTTGGSQQSPRTYGRIVNIRPSNSTGVGSGVVGDGAVGGGLNSSNRYQGQIISGDLGAVCSTVAGSFPAMKRIRIVTNEPRLSPQIRQVTGASNKIGVGGNLAIPTGNAAPPGPETVLLVTNQGETMLSTTQGGVTVLAQPHSQMSLPGMGELGDHEQQRLETDQQLRPVITSIISQGEQHPPSQQDDDGGDLEAEQMDEVVYSIAEICGDNEAGGENEHEVLLHSGQEVAAEEDEMLEKKPFLQN